MASLYTTNTISGYNDTPPTDDGAQTAANEITWAKHKSKLADPVKTLTESINTSLVTALGGSTLDLDGTMSLVLDTDADTIIRATTSDDLIEILTGNTEAMRIDASQRVIIGGAAAQDIGRISQLQNLGTDNASASASLGCWSTSGTVVSDLDFLKSKNATIGSHTTVADTDVIGNISFKADDGATYDTVAARITAYVDGTPGTGDVPGQMRFFTQVAAGSVTEALRIDSGQRSIFGGTASVPTGGNNCRLQAHGTTVDGSSLSLIAYTTVTGANSTLFFGRTRSASIGTVGTAVVDGDDIGEIRWAGDDGTDVGTVAVTIRGEVEGTVAANQVPGRLVFMTATSAGAVTEAMRIDATQRVAIGTTADVDRRLVVEATSGIPYQVAAFISRVDDANTGPDISLWRDRATPAANDLIGRVSMDGETSTGVRQTYAMLQAVIVDPTNASFDGEMQIRTAVAGTRANRLSVAQGVWTAGATGGDQGADTINATTYYAGGTAGVASFGPSAVTSITVKGGIITAIS